MAIDTIKSTAVLDGAIATADIADDAVTSAKIADDAVTSAKLGGALTTPSNLTVGGVLDATTATFDRASTDGVIVNLQKNNGSIGSIDVDNGDNLTVQGKSDHSGLQFGTNAIFPHKNSANIDATIDLGESSLRWKDIYLSGGVNFSANANAAGMTSETLDDYEEGTWTPILKGSSGNPSGQSYNQQTGTYTKVGRKVHVQAYISVANIGTGMSGTYAYLSDLPFTISAGNSMYPSGLFGYIHNLGQNVNSLLAYGNQGSTFAYVTYQNGAGTTSAYLSPAGWGSTPSLMFAMTYFTDA